MKEEDRNENHRARDSRFGIWLKRQEIFEIKKQIVNTLVRRITIDRNRKLQVEISLNLLNIINDDTPEGFEGKNKGQIAPTRIYPNKLDLTAPVYLTITL